MYFYFAIFSIVPKNNILIIFLCKIRSDHVPAFPIFGVPRKVSRNFHGLRYKTMNDWMENIPLSSLSFYQIAFLQYKPLEHRMYQNLH